MRCSSVFAMGRDEHAEALFNALIGRGKRPMQAIVVIMRKLLHAIHAMFRAATVYDGKKAYGVNFQTNEALAAAMS